MSFGAASALFLLFLLPAVAALLQLRQREERKRISRLADPELLQAITQGERRTNNQFLLYLALSLLVLALARPRAGVEQSTVNRFGVDIVVAVDVSTSMLARDVQPSRLGRAKRKIVDLVRLLQGDRVGLVAFAGEAFLETPLTYDYSAFLSYLQLLSPDLIPIQGTNIEAAITTSIQALLNRTGDLEIVQSESVERSRRGKAVVLLTDGEGFDGDLAKAKALAAANGVKLFIIGVGTEKGAPIPEGKGYRYGADGSVIVTRLQGEEMERLARESGGIYLESIGSSEDTRAIYQGGIRSLLEAGDLGQGQGKVYRELFQIPLFCAVILLFIYVAGANRKSLPIARLTLLVGALFFSRGSFADPPNSDELTGYRARQAFEESRYEESVQEFSKQSDDPRYLLGKGAGEYRLGKFEDALKSFQDAAGKSSGKLHQEALFNSGNALAQLGKYEEAIKSYEEGLKDGEDQDTSTNLEYVKKLINPPPAESKENQKDESKDNDSKDNESKESQENSDSKSKNSESSDSEKRDQNDKSNSKGSDANKNDSDKNDTEGNKESKGDENKENEKKDNQSEDKKNADKKNEEEREKGDSADAEESKQDRGEKDLSGSGEKKEEKKDPADSPKGEGQDKDQEKGDRGEKASTSGKETPQQSEARKRAEAVLGTVGESYDALQEFRRQEAEERIEQGEVTPPEHDW